MRHITKLLIKVSLILLIVAPQIWAADTVVYTTGSKGSITWHRWVWSTNDGQVEKPTTQATGLSPPIWGLVIGVHFIADASNPPDSDHNIYLYDSRLDFDWLFGVGVGLDGSARTATTNNRTPITSDNSYPVLYGVRLGPAVTGTGTGTRAGSIILTVREVK